MRTAKVVSISLPPDMVDEIQELATEERRSVSEVMREALRRYACEKALEAVRKEAKKKIKRLKLTEEDIVKMVRDGRK